MSKLLNSWRVATDPLWNIVHTMAALGDFRDAEVVLGSPGAGFLQPLRVASNLAACLDLPLLTCGHHNTALAEAYLPEQPFRQHFNYAGDYHAQVRARHAGEQAVWIASTMRELDASSIAVSVHHSHRPRFVATLAEALRREFAPGDNFAEKIIYVVDYPDNDDLLLDVAAETAGGQSVDPLDYRTKHEWELFVDEHDRYAREGYQTSREDGTHDMLTPHQVRAYASWWMKNATLRA